MTLADAKRIVGPSARLRLGDPEQVAALRLLELHAKIARGDVRICPCCLGDGKHPDDTATDCYLCEGRGLLNHELDPYAERVPLDVRLALRSEAE